MLPTIIWRHPRENIKKCTVQPLSKKEGFEIYDYPILLPFPQEKYILLTLAGPELSQDDIDYGCFVIDATWRYAEKMGQKVPKLIPRTLPSHFRTAYPRKQTACRDPIRGLATIEAIYIAYTILQRPIEGLLDQYYWKEAFLAKNNFS